MDWLKKSFKALMHCSAKKLEKISFVMDGYFRKGSLNFNFSIAPIKSNYGDIIFSFPNKLKLDDSNMCTQFLIREQRIINDCQPNTLIPLKSYV